MDEQPKIKDICASHANQQQMEQQRATQASSKRGRTVSHIIWVGDSEDEKEKRGKEGGIKVTSYTVI